MLADETIDTEPTLCAVIDDALVQFRGRTLVSSCEVVDFLPDVRMAVDVEMRLGGLLAPNPS